MATATTNAKPWWETERLEAQRIDPSLPPAEWCKTTLNWQVKKSPVTFDADHIDPETNELIRAKSIQLNDRFVIYRTDTLKALTTNASKKYHIHSIEQLCEAMAIVCESGGYQMSTIGSIKGGKEIWFMANTGNDVNIAGEPFKRNVIIGTSYDQSKTTWAICSDVAVVCQNTLNYAINSSDQVFKVSHLTPYNPAQVVGDLKQISQHQVAMEASIDKLANAKCSADDALLFFSMVADLMPIPQKVKDAKSNVDELIKLHREKLVAEIQASYISAPGARLATRQNNYHGATQAVIHFVDHKMLLTQKAREVAIPGTEQKVLTRSKANRFERTFLSDGAKLKTKAFNMALQKVA